MHESNPSMVVSRQEVSGISHEATRTSTRSKDPLRNIIAPRRTAPPPAAKSRRATQLARREWRVDKVLGEVIRSLQVLDAGGERPEYWAKQGPGVNMTKADHGEMDRLRRVCGEFVERHGDALGASTGEERAALVRLCGEGVGYEASRGDVVPFDLSKVSLPATDRAFDLCQAIPELGNWKTWMLHDDEPLLLHETPCYGDPRLSSGRSGLTTLALRLWNLGLVEPVRREGGAGFKMFCVSKGEGMQRLVFDARRVNRLFKAPPSLALGSPRALSYLDLSDDALGGDEVCGFYGDVPVMFYRLQGPPGLSSWLWLDDLDFASFIGAAVSQGADPACFAGFDGLGFTRLPMGFSWAPLLAERSLEFLLDEAGYSSDARLLHGQDTPALRQKRPVAMPYLDDFMGIRCAPGAGEAEAGCRADLERCRGIFRERGLDVHKDGVGQCFESLGVELHLEAGKRRVLPKRDKFSRLLMATKCAAGAKFLSPRQLSKVLGHWAWWLSLQPALFSLLSEVYAFTRPKWGGMMWYHENQDVALAVPEGVRAELRLLCKLAPFVRADLGWPVDSRVSMTDACLVRGAACYSDQSADEVRQMVQTSGSWERAVEPPAKDFCNPAQWKVAAKTKWRREGRIDALEGEALLLGLRHAVRSRTRRRRRVLCFVDNQALLGSLRKGRSSAVRLLHICRRVAAHALFAELRLHYRYVPSALNVADAPSRGKPNAGCQAWQSMTADEMGEAEAECAAAETRRRKRRFDAIESEYEARLAEIDAIFGPTPEQLWREQGLHSCATGGCSVLCPLADHRCLACSRRKRRGTLGSLAGAALGFS